MVADEAVSFEVADAQDEQRITRLRGAASWRRETGHTRFITRIAIDSG